MNSVSLVKRWFYRFLAFVLFMALIIVLNPEVRGLLLFVEAVGWDVVLIIAATQLRALLPYAQMLNHHILVLACAFASFVAWLTLRRLPVIFDSRLLSCLLLPVLMILPYGLQCHSKRTRSGADQLD